RGSRGAPRAEPHRGDSTPDRNGSLNRPDGARTQRNIPVPLAPVATMNRRYAARGRRLGDVGKDEGAAGPTDRCAMAILAGLDQRRSEGTARMAGAQRRGG